MKAEIFALPVLLRACAKNKDLYAGARIHAHILKWGLLEKWVCIPSSLLSMYAKCGALTKAQQLLHDTPFQDVFSWTALISGYVDHGPSEEALSCFERMQLYGIDPNPVTFTCILKACANLGAITKGEQIHDEIVRQGLLTQNVVLGSALVCMYAKCGSLVKARRVLDELPVQNAVSWNALIGGYAQQGQGKEALSCLEQMRNEGLVPDAVTFLLILKSCAAVKAIDDGERIHHEMLSLGILESNVDLVNALVDLYAKCGAFEKAQQVLEELPFHSVVSWNALITGYTQQGQGVKALKCFERIMQLKGLSPNEVTFICALKACSSIQAIEKGQAIHDEIVNQRLLENNVVLGTALVDMYAKCGSLVKAQEVLEGLPVQDVVCWNALIAGYTQEGLNEKALSCFERMQDEGCSPNATTFSCILKACCSIGFVQKGGEIHEEIMKCKLLGNNIVLGTALVDLYAKHGALVKARQVLEDLPARDIVSWNALIAGYAQQGLTEEALDCLEHMQRDGLSSNEVTFCCILKACGNIGALDKGEQLHDEIARQGLLQENTILANSLVDMYAKCGALEKAWQVLREPGVGSVVSWSAVIAGYAQHGRGKEALKCFESMQQMGFYPDAVTFSCLLNACSQSGVVEEGQKLFETMTTKYGLNPEVEHCTCMVRLFGSAGQFEKVVGIIERMPPSANSAVWSSLLGASEKWGDVEVGRWAFEHVLHSEKNDALAHAYG